MARPKTRSKPDRPRGATTDVKPPPFDGQQVVFSFLYADRGQTEDWRWCQGGEWQDLLEFLCQMGRLTWNEIRAQTTGGRGDRRAHKKHHYQEPSSLKALAQRRLAEMELQQRFDDSEFFRFRLEGKQRLWGYVNNGVFYVVWWDHNHQVYPVD